MKTPTIITLTLLTLCAAAPAHAGPGKPLTPTGWKGEGGVETYDQKTVFKVINGAAELYLSYGMSRLQVHKISKGDLRVALQVYTLGSALDALGVFLRERPDGATDLEETGATGAAFDAPAHCLALKGPYYLRVQVTAGELTKETCLAILSRGSDSIKDKGKLPREFVLLPAEGRIRDSLGYTRQSFLGLRELSGCLHARYRSGKKTYTRFLLIAADDKAVEKVRALLLQKKWTAGKVGDRAVMYRTVPYKGTVAVARAKGGFIGVAGLGDKKATLKMLGGM